MIRRFFGTRGRLMLLLSIAGALSALVACASPSSVGVQNQPAYQPEVSQPANQGEVNVPDKGAPTTQPVPATVEVVVAGYLSHGPMQPTVRAIKDVLTKYGDKVDVTWVDLSTKEGADYFKENNLSAHMNVIINGKYTYDVNGKEVTFQWLEGQQWTRQDLDAVLANLLSK